VKINRFPEPVVNDHVFFPENNPGYFLQPPFSLQIVSCQREKRLLSFPLHDPCHLGHILKEVLCMKRNLRTAGPKGRIRKYLLQISDQLPDKGDIPDVTGKTDNIRSASVYLLHDLVLRLI